ncbi:MAG: hypothetical protein KC912_14485 [Proteobacteria bacterium]|nr:hypothetical protein [Pseudomonadota bacterium]
MPTTRAIVDALRADAVGAAVISVAILLLFVGAELFGRFTRAPTEWTRKGTHVGAGAVVLCFPWLVQHTETVVVLSSTFAGLLVGGRVTGLLSSIHNVERRTGGAYYYPFAVLLAWILSGGEALTFCVPLAVMAVADTGAALVGQRAGETTFRVMDGSRSVEGSLAFFGLAFGVVLTGCALDGRPGWPGILLVTLVVAILTTSVEAISVRGSDNILIPYAAWLGLDRTLRLGLSDLGGWVEGMILAIGVLLATRERAGLDVAGGVTVFLIVTLTWALGGTTWLLPLLGLYALVVFFRPDRLEGRVEMVFPTAAGALVWVLAFAHSGAPELHAPYVSAVAANGAIAGLLLAPASVLGRVTGVAVGLLVPSVTMAWAVPGTPLVAVVLTAFMGLGLYRLLERTPLMGKRLVATASSGLLLLGIQAMREMA